MSISKEITAPGNGRDKPKVGDTITVAYSGYLYDSKKRDKGFRGKL